jgi:hypothetical protein
VILHGHLTPVLNLKNWALAKSVSLRSLWPEVLIVIMAGLFKTRLSSQWLSHG